jgi:predicted DNA-binding WGR domain protein
MPRHFEFVEGSSSKFWEVAVSGNDVTVRFGRIGTGGQTQTKTFADGEKAQKHAEKLIAEKTGKGYRETSGSASS